MKKIVLVDGSSYLFRAYHALPNLYNSQGEPTGAILGVINMLKKLSKIYDTKYITVVFDSKGKNFRHEMYPQYKSNRKSMDDNLRVQLKPLYEIIKKLGYPVLIIDGVEADDVIGTLTRELDYQGYYVVIATADKDMIQLITERVVLYDSMTNITTDIARVLDKYKIRPDQMVDYLALTGDSSDNIPGVPQVGPKTAIKWLQKYENINGVIDNSSEIKGKVGDNLRKNIEILKLSYQLATIKCYIDISFSIEELKCKKADLRYLQKSFTRYGFNSLLKNLNVDTNSSTYKTNIKFIKVDYITVTSDEELYNLILELRKSDIFAFNIEIDFINIDKANLLGLSFCAQKNRAYYIPIQHKSSVVSQQLNLAVVLSKLAPIFIDSQKVKIVHNFKFYSKFLSKYGIDIKGQIHDTMVMAYTLKSSGKYDKYSLLKEYFDISPIAYNELTEKSKIKQPLDQIEINKIANYSAESAYITFRLFNHFDILLKKEIYLYKLYLDIEMPLTFILNKMERIGVKIDFNKLIKQSKHLEKNIVEIEKKCYEIAGLEFNLSSPIQLRKIFFENIGMPSVIKTAKGDASTSENVLVALSEEYEIAALMIDYRHLSKLKNTYTDKLPKILDINSRVHTSYNQTGTITGRLSSSDPNLQNIPIRSLEGRKIRQAFIAENGNCLVAADYSQIELRIMADLSKDENLLKSFKEDLDIHNATAAEIYGIHINEVTRKERRQAKAINFGLIYGMSAFGLAKQLKIPIYDAQKYMEVYFNRYPKVKEYMMKSKEFARENGYVETILGRRLYLPEINSRNIKLKNSAERAAINAPMQGTAADIIKKAMIDVNTMISQDYNSEVKMLMQVHDELVFEIKENKVAEVSEKIKKLMECSINLSVPLKIIIGIGDNWDQAH